MPEEKLVGGLRCSDVLDLLSDYLDGELAAARRAQIEAHLRGCDGCERFGQAFAGVVGDLRRRLVEPEPLDADVSERLKVVLAAR